MAQMQTTERPQMADMRLDAYLKGLERRIELLERDNAELKRTAVNLARTLSKRRGQ